MFKLKPLLVNSRLVLSRKGLDNCVAGFSRTPLSLGKKKGWQEREPCPPRPPPPPEPLKDRRVMIGMLTLTAITGYLAVHAKQDPEFRDWLSVYAPWFDDFVAIVYQENMTYPELYEHSVENFKEFMAPTKKKPRTCSLDGTPLPCDPAGDDGKKRIECPPKKAPPRKEGEAAPCVILDPPVITKNICELEGCIKEQADAAIHGYMTARDACKYYNELVMTTMTTVTTAGLKEMQAAKEERKALLEEHVANADRAAKNLANLNRYMDCGTIASKEEVENTKRLLLEVQTLSKRMKIEYTWADEISRALDQQVTMVSKMVNKFIGEIQTLFPSVKFEAVKPQINEDADLLLIHCKRYVAKLRDNLLDEAASMCARSDMGFEALPPLVDIKDKAERDKVYSELLGKRKAALEDWYKSRTEAINKESQKLLDCALNKQKEQLQKVLEVKLKQKEGEDTDRMLEEAVAEEKKKLDKDLAEMGKKVKAAEDKLAGHLKAEKEARKSQDLWAAGSSLLAATKKGGGRVKVNKELDALRKVAGQDDTLVNSVLSNIPEKILKEGVVPWAVLRDRYFTMEEVARKVALVEQEGANLVVYLISYIQSLFLFMKLNGIPQEDIDKPIREDMGDLDTFDILQRARYWVQQGNLAAAVSYVNGLEGASRAAAVPWVSDAQALLQVRQAAEAILAHAAALGLQYV